MKDETERIANPADEIDRHANQLYFGSDTDPGGEGQSEGAPPMTSRYTVPWFPELVDEIPSGGMWLLRRIIELGDVTGPVRGEDFLDLLMAATGVDEGNAKFFVELAVVLGILGAVVVDVAGAPENPNADRSLN
jgi:hypothetical protein